jgi:hypothetical protein
MRRLLVLAMVALLASGVAFAAKIDELNNTPDYSNDSQAPASTAATPQITEDFEAGVPPAGWSTVDDDGSGLVWTACIATGQSNDTNGSGDCAIASSDDFGSASYDTSLITESYNFCASVNSGMDVSLNFQNYAGYDWFYIDCSADGGANWVNYLAWNEDHGTWGNPPGEDVSLDISDMDGEASVICRFRYYDPVVHFNWWVMVDDFVLMSDGAITTPGVPDCGGGGVPATTGIGLMLLVLALGGSSAYFLRRK